MKLSDNSLTVLKNFATINNSIPASSATIDVVAKDSDNEKEII